PSAGHWHFSSSFFLPAASFRRIHFVYTDLSTQGGFLPRCYEAPFPKSPNTCCVSYFPAVLKTITSLLRVARTKTTALQLYISSARASLNITILCWLPPGWRSLRHYCMEHAPRNDPVNEGLLQ